VTRLRRAAPALVGLCVLVFIACGRKEAPAGRGGGSDPFLSIVADDPHGRSLRFADFKGKVRVIDVWATWCGPCRMTIPELNALYERHRGRGLVVIGVSVDDASAAVLEFQRAVPMRYPSVMFNPALALVIGQPSSIPTTFVVARDGTVHKTFIGYVDAATLEEEVLRLL